ncbi:DMT family transporter [Marinomonas sp. C2222]|uniref:DMT family transporter n=1 Tax=Marinomonas sargassi TaxID=2984494 RepID=A0ABT2YRG3_9GAMM|nr:DMT family transporter [Marinomonas sargassi]MCV2402484.1 DMT family transporter [Marinomonas sargassi]
MMFYIGLGIFVNCIWGTAFLIPHILEDTNPTVIALGRYFSYGILSLLIMFFARKHWQGLTNKQWLFAFLFGFVGNFGYYLLLASSIHFGGIVTTSLIIGILPVSLLITGNFLERNIPFRRLLLPILLILSGMLALSVQHKTGTHLAENYLVGSLLAFGALVMWTYFGVGNARFLKHNSEITSNTWALAIGIGCLLQCLISLPFIMIFTDWFSVLFSKPSSSLWSLLGISLFLGVIVSWWAAVLWNRASRNLPIGLCGQLLVFETLSSLTYGFIADWRLPETMEFISIFLVVSGVFIVLRNKW